jgi:hypothetical protein
MTTHAFLPHGIRLELDGELPVRAVDPYGTDVWSATWAAGTLQHLQLRLPDRTWIEVHPRAGSDPLFGVCDTLARPGEPPRARFAAVHWAAPDRIPPLDRPAAVPAGAGSAVLNLMALLARRAGIETMPYVGPYPTAALFDALLHSFAVPLSEDPAAALQRFTASVETDALRGTMRTVPVDFIPHPFAWHFVTPDVCVALREGIERVWVSGRPFDRDRRGSRRLRADGNRIIAYVEIAGAPWCDVLVLDPRGSVLEGPHPISEAPVNLIGLELPAEMREVLVAILVSRAPTLLVEALRQELATAAFRFADTGSELGRAVPGAIEIHAALADRLAPKPPRVMLDLLVEAVEPVVQRKAQDRLARG